MTCTVGILYPGHSTEDDYPAIQRILGDGVRLPLVHITMNEHALRTDALLDVGSDVVLSQGNVMVTDRIRW